MNNYYQRICQQAGLVGVICSSLVIGLPAIAMPRMEANKLLSQSQPRPSIFNEPPYNRVQRPSTSPPANVPGSTPLPEQQQPPSATVTPTDGKVSVKLVNATGANITYQVIGDTNQRTLAGKSDVMLQDLPTPVTVTFKRQDGGLLQVTPQASSEQSGMLEVTLAETTDLGTDKSAMRINSTGGVYLN